MIITALFGDPVGHSVSDIMFCRFAKLTGLKNYTHLKLRIPADNKRNLEVAMQAMRVFDFAGVNITLPYKEEVIKYLDKFDRTASFAGAVNTIVSKPSGLFGYNTDSYGAVSAISKRLRSIKDSDVILILGVGGAARAIIGGLPRTSAITVLYKDSDFHRAKKLEKHFKRHNVKVVVRTITDTNIVAALRKANFVINATPVGMFPEPDSSLIHDDHLSSVGRPLLSKMYFFDVVFNPFETKFLRLAKQHGAKTCPGIYMMVYQGSQAFKLWTGKSIPAEYIESVVTDLKKAIYTEYGK